MNKKEFSNKEILIFEGILSLMQSGKPPHLIKSEEIAKATGMGKGTLYNYFDSKDEMIEQTIFYYMNKQWNTVLEKIENANTFKEKIYVLFSLSNKKGEPSPPCAPFFSRLSNEDLHFYLEKSFPYYEEAKSKFQFFFNNLLKVGIKENLFPIPKDNEYALWVLLDIITGFLTCSAAPFMAKDNNINFEKIKDYSYDLLIKGLN